MATIFTIDGYNTSCCVRDSIGMTSEHVMSRDDFTTAFPDVDITGIRGLSFEPDRNIYHIVDDNWNMTSYESPSDDTRLQYVNDNIALILQTFQDADPAE